MKRKNSRLSLGGLIIITVINVLIYSDAIASTSASIVKTLPGHFTQYQSDNREEKFCKFHAAFRYIPRQSTAVIIN